MVVGKSLCFTQTQWFFAGVWLKHHLSRGANNKHQSVEKRDLEFVSNTTEKIWKLTRRMQNDVCTKSIAHCACNAQIGTLIKYSLCLWLSFEILGDVSWMILCQRWSVDWGRGCLRYQTPAQFWLIRAGVFGFAKNSDFKYQYYIFAN